MHQITFSDEAGTDGFANVLSRMVGLTVVVAIASGSAAIEGEIVSCDFDHLEYKHVLTIKDESGERTVDVADVASVEYC